AIFVAKAKTAVLNSVRWTGIPSNRRHAALGRADSSRNSNGLLPLRDTHPVQTSSFLARWLRASSIVVLVFYQVSGHSNTVTWIEDFELGWDGWHEEATAGDVWQVGDPANGPPINTL